MSELNAIDHIAIPVTDIPAAVDWYKSRFQCEVKYQDATWALLGFANIQLALVIPSQHPAHIGFVTADAKDYGELKTHRDGTRSCYVRDPAGNSIEMLAAESMPEYK
jgi:catechol 2,3-dioxygenase-like lactoylglutathione lyase family enzyme